MTEHVIGLNIPVCLILPPLFYPEDDLGDDNNYYCFYLFTHDELTITVFKPMFRNSVETSMRQL